MSDSASSATQGCNSSSSSSFPSSAGCDYEVFLSFNGVDIRTSFTDHLYNALLDRGIRTFRDNEEFKIGEKMDPVLWSGIRQSKIAIPIFSKNYASSEWCLRELAEIVKCMKQRNQRQITVKPIFYHVDPWYVRFQAVSYMEPLLKCGKEFGQETDEWKKALEEVGSLYGWELKKIANGHEGELIKLIVKEVWSVLRKSPLIIPHDNLVGCDFHVGKMMKFLKIESDDKRIVVGIHGLSGIGKTTIARCVFNEVYHKFDACSFIIDAQETFQKKGPVYIQSQLISNILNLDNPNITSVDHGIQMMTERLLKKRVLLVFDDVEFDLKKIIGEHDWLSFGSRIIITTKDRHILDVFGVDKTYEPSGMDLVQALQLFSKHAFKKDQPPKHLLYHSKEVVKTAGGLPLALEIIGSFLFGVEDPKIWKDTAEELKIIPNEKVQEKLKISYDGLNPREKKIFLDIACFFNGMNKNIACYIWDGLKLFPEKGIEVLLRKSLVKRGENNELRMHALLQALGREIVNQEKPEKPGKRSRLWAEQEILKVLNTQTGTNKVEGLCIESNRQPLKSEGFSTMTNIRLLKLDYAVVSGDFVHSFPDLRWLCWKGFRNTEFTLTNSRNLTVLDLSHGYVTKNWPGWISIKEAENLKFLDLSYSAELSQTPNFSTNLQLEVLLLQGCENLVTIDASIGHLKRLVVLKMGRCKNLKNLPGNICELRSLKTLDLRSTNINQFPENLNRLESLTELLIDRNGIKRLPNSIGQLRNLITLSVGCCEIQDGGIPDDIGRLSSLLYLNLNGNQFNSLPATVSNLSLLHTLYLVSCKNLQSLPQLSNLTNLKALNLGLCENLAELPITMNALTKLESLNLQRCNALQYIPRLPSRLKSLEVLECENVREISAFWDMRSLETLRLKNCPRLTKIESLEGLDSLQLFVIHECHSLTNLPTLRGLKNLRYIEFKNVGLAKIEGLDDLESVQNLSIVGCGKLIEVPSVDGLESLELLSVHRCESMEILPDLSNLTKLRELSIIQNEKLNKILGVDKLKILERLSIGGLISIETLPSLSNLKKLKFLSAIDCRKLTEIQGVDELEYLENLCIDGCISIETLPCLSNLKKLKILSIMDCMKLTEIQGVEELESLMWLNVRGCLSLKLPNPSLIPGYYKAF